MLLKSIATAGYWAHFTIKCQYSSPKVLMSFVKVPRESEAATKLLKEGTLKGRLIRQ